MAVMVRGSAIPRRIRAAVGGLAVAGLLRVGGVAAADPEGMAGDLDTMAEDLQAAGRSGYEVFPPLPPSPVAKPQVIQHEGSRQAHSSSVDQGTTRAKQPPGVGRKAGPRATPSLIRAVVHKHGGQTGSQGLASDLIRRGTEALNEGAIERALRLLAEGVRLDPACARGYTNLGAAWLRAGRPGAAVASLETAVALDPDQAAAWNDLALAEWRNGSPDLAREHFLRAAAKDPASGSALTNLALLQSQAGEPEVALLTLRRALTCAYVPAKAHLQLALLLDAAGRAGEAASHLEIFLATADSDDTALAARLHPHLAALRATQNTAPSPRPLASDE